MDKLYAGVRAYRSTDEYRALLEFIRELPEYAPYNCFLLYVQNPGACYVATAGQWRKRFNRNIRDGARPLVILRPFGPVEFVFDVEDTVGEPLDDSILRPFRARGPLSPEVWDMTIRNCARELIAITETDAHQGRAGQIGPARDGDTVKIRTRDPQTREPVTVERRACWRMLLNRKHETPTRYATVAHELGHLYCGHLGTPDEKWLPRRSRLSPAAEEFEAESVAYLVCSRAGINNPSERYLFNYFACHREIPQISVETVLKAAGTVEKLGRHLLQIRKLKVQNEETS
ncbi:MAG: hypothetical protein R6X33_14410 [Candidatus Brocadiia bacterium]